MTATTPTHERVARPTDEQVLASRLAWLASASTEEEAHLIESALLARTDNGLHEDDLTTDDAR